MIRPERLLENAERACKKAFGGGLATALVVEIRQVSQALGRVGVVWARVLLPDGQSAAVERLRFNVPALQPLDLRQVVGAYRHVGMIRPECFFANLKRPARQRFCLGEAPLRTEQLRQIAQGSGNQPMLRAKRRLANLERAL